MCNGSTLSKVGIEISLRLFQLQPNPNQLWPAGLTPFQYRTCLNIAVTQMSNVEKTQTREEEATNKKGHCRLTAPGAEASYNPYTLYESLIHNTGPKHLTEK